jgi:site-specific recombinase XerD
MSNKLDAAVGEVRKYLEDNNYSYSITMSHKRCFQLFRQYLADHKKPYGKHEADQWLLGITQGLCLSTLKVYRQALEKLDAAYHRKPILNTKVQYNGRQKYQHLESWCKSLLDEFMKEIPSEYGDTYIRTIRNSIARFMDYLTYRGITTLKGISHRIIADFYRDDEHDSTKSKDVYNNCIRKFLGYLAEREIIQDSIPLTLDKFVLSHLVFMESLPPEIQGKFNTVIRGDSISAEEYYKKTIDLQEIIDQHKYSKTMKKVFRQAWKELFVFLEANSIPYTQGNALAWANHMQQHVTQWKTFRRAFELFGQYWSTNQIDPRVVFTYQPDRAEDLPEWCKAEYERFVTSKQKDGFAESTLSMYRSSCLRFLEYLLDIGIDSWCAITPEVLKGFHRQDPHSTSEGKNAYSSKIRIFLEHLGELQLVPPALFMALPSENAPRISIVKTLSDDDIENLKQFRNQADTAMALRDVAVITIGLRMGIRASDISNIKFSDISWEQKTISVQQQKTGKFLKLPMPVEVGNAIYRYIINGRPDIVSEHVFITHRVPYSKLHRGGCRKALVKALPNQTGGFHVTRKTYASRMLVKNVKTDRISEALGHENNSTVMRYLSTNDEKMRMCALSLAMIPVEGGALL